MSVFLWPVDVWNLLLTRTLSVLVRNLRRSELTWVLNGTSNELTVRRTDSFGPKTYMYCKNVAQAACDRGVMVCKMFPWHTSVPLYQSSIVLMPLYSFWPCASNNEHDLPVLFWLRPAWCCARTSAVHGTVGSVVATHQHDPVSAWQICFISVQLL